MHKKKMRITEDFTPVGEVVSISDNNGQPIQVTDAASSTKTLPDKLNVVIEATHTGINRNKVSYSYDKLERSTDSWLRDYEKPVLLNHDSWSDPLGRVKSSAFKQSQIDPQKHCIQLSLEITNKAAIERFLDGRYKTFSIGGYTDSAVCSICGKDQMTDGWCGHYRGKKYDGKECYWHLGLMDYDEISVVNTPADVHAQAISVTVVDPEAKPEDGVPQGGEGNQADNAGKDDPLTIIDNLTGNQGANGGVNNTPNGRQTDSADGTGDNGDNKPPVADDNNNGTGEGDNQNPPTTDGDNGDDNQGSQEDELTKLRNQVKTLEERQTVLTAEVTAKDEALTAKDSEISTLTTERDTLKTKLQSKTDENEGLVKQNVTLAKFSHKILCEKVAELQIAVGDKRLEDKQTLLTDYATFTSKKLNDMALELTKPEKIAQRAKVTSPGIVGDGTENPEGTAPPEKTGVTLQDYAKTMTQFLVKNRV